MYVALPYLRNSTNLYFTRRDRNPLFYILRAYFSWCIDTRVHVVRKSARPCVYPCSLQWRHNKRYGLSNHRRFHSLLKCGFRCRSKKTSKLRSQKPVMRKMFPFDDAIMIIFICSWVFLLNWYCVLRYFLGMTEKNCSILKNVQRKICGFEYCSFVKNCIKIYLHSNIAKACSEKVQMNREVLSQIAWYFQDHRITMTS